MLYVENDKRYNEMKKQVDEYKMLVSTLLDNVTIYKDCCLDEIQHLEFENSCTNERVDRIIRLFGDVCTPDDKKTDE